MKYIEHLTFTQFAKTVIQLFTQDEGGVLLDGLLK